MTIKSEVDKILDLVTAQTEALAALATAVASINTGGAGDPTLGEKIAALTEAVNAVKHDVEEGDEAPPAA